MRHFFIGFALGSFAAVVMIDWLTEVSFAAKILVTIAAAAGILSYLFLNNEARKKDVHTSWLGDC